MLIIWNAVFTGCILALLDTVVLGHVKYRRGMAKKSRCLYLLSLPPKNSYLVFFIKEMDRQNKAVYVWLTDDTFHTEMYFVSVTRLEGY